MTITFIDSNKSIPNERLSLMTDPPLTEEVFDKFSELGFAHHFMFEDGLLSLTKGALVGLNQNSRKAIEQRLTEAENALAREEQERQDFHKTFVQGMSQQTGIPVYTKPA